ncbi:hypothetical protein GCM10007874_11560 [Labrys miyagiensis]|uniref:Uncharacterized protein n=1 Tax=Labrys miyagiensis TaxID=346912 RepID=A0ABQ6CDC4_9HYPH|nr:hypothetical protein [Labrys miyagiensis]GLS18140.1 hypothetical protein GCM10007874_11560 [Labrys miyagiensis]
MSGYLPAALMNQPMRTPPVPAPGAMPPGMPTNVLASDPWAAVGDPVSTMTWDQVGVPVADIPLPGDSNAKGSGQGKGSRLVPVTDPDVIKELNAMQAPGQQGGGKWWEAAPLASAAGQPDQGSKWWEKAPPADQKSNPFDQFDTPQQQAAKPNPFDQFDTPPARAPRLVPVQGDPFADEQTGQNGGQSGMVRVPIVAGKAGVVGYRMVPQSQLNAGTTGALEDAGRVAANGATLGGFDNAVAGAQTLFQDPLTTADLVAGRKPSTFEENLAAQHALTQQAMQRPGSGFLYNSAALAPGMVGAGGAALGARALGGGLVANLGTNAAAGALLSGADAFNSADGSIPDRFQAAKMPAYVGAGLGIAVPPVAELLGNLASAGARKVANAFYDTRYGTALPRAAADPILAGINMQGGSVPQVQQTLSTLGPGSTLADTGEGLLGQTNRLANNDIAVRPGISQNLNDRLLALDQRLGAAVDQNFGQDVNAVTQMENLKAQTAANGKQLYGQAFANPNAVDVTPILAKIDQQIAPGVTGMVGSGVKDDPITAALRQARSYIAGNGSQAANIQTLHRAQDVIDDMAASAFRSGNNAQARALWGVRNDLLGQMDAVNPEYAAARQQYASDKSVENAFENGRNILTTRQDGQVFDPDLLESRLASMSAPEKQAYQLGARKAVTDVMGQARSDPAGLRTKLANDNGYAVGKLRQVFGDGPVNSMLGELDAQATMRNTNNAVLGNSATAFRSAADETIPGFSKEARATGGEGAGSLPLSIMGGKEVGEQIGSMFGHPELGAAVGAVAGPAFKWAGGRIASSRLAASEGEQAAARAAIAEALSSSSQPARLNALLARERMSSAPSNASEGAKAVTRAILMQQAAEGRNSVLYAPAQRFLPAPLVGQ